MKYETAYSGTNEFSGNDFTHVAINENCEYKFNVFIYLTSSPFAPSAQYVTIKIEVLVNSSLKP